MATVEEFCCLIEKVSIDFGINELPMHAPLQVKYSKIKTS